MKYFNEDFFFFFGKKLIIFFKSKDIKNNINFYDMLLFEKRFNTFFFNNFRKGM